MAESAAVAVAALNGAQTLSDSKMWRVVAWSSSLVGRVSCFCRNSMTRIVAKFAYHDARLYRSQVHRVGNLVGQADISPALFHTLRRLDPHGLGVWFLSRIPDSPKLTDLCRRAIALPGIGPPRPVARLLEQALAGKPVCWFGGEGGFDALAAETMISAALAAGLTATELVWCEGKPSWSNAQTNLGIVANVLRSAARLHLRVAGQQVVSAETAATLAYQAVNVVRRALNHTDLMAVDEHLANEAARLALTAANSACSAALDLMGKPVLQTKTTLDTVTREKLASLARTVDALVSRVAAAARADSPATEAKNLLTERAARLLTDAHRSLRPWIINLPVREPGKPNNNASEICRRTNELAEVSAETLEAWAVLHEVFQAVESESDSVRPGSSCSRPPLWATRLLETLLGKWTPQDVIESVRGLAGPADRALPAAICLAALRRGSPQLQCELWKLIQDADTSSFEKSLAFQVFWRCVIVPHCHEIE